MKRDIQLWLPVSFRTVPHACNGMIAGYGILASVRHPTCN
jgi:hypothetical protein